MELLGFSLRLFQGFFDKASERISDSGFRAFASSVSGLRLGRWGVTGFRVKALGV